MRRETPRERRPSLHPSGQFKGAFIAGIREFDSFNGLLRRKACSDGGRNLALSVPEQNVSLDIMPPKKFTLLRHVRNRFVIVVRLLSLYGDDAGQRLHQAKNTF